MKGWRRRRALRSDPRRWCRQGWHGRPVHFDPAGPGQQAWAREQSGILVAGLRDAKYQIVGDLGELLPPPATERYVPPTRLPAEQLLDVALRATAALADHQYRGDIITSGSDLTVGMNPGRRRPVSRLGLAILKRSRIKRMLYRASNRPTVRNLRVLVWRILARPGRRHG